MFGFFNTNSAKILYNSGVTFDDENNPIEGLETEILINVDKQPRLENKKITSSNVDFNYSFSVYSEIFDIPENKELRIVFENETKIYDIIRIENFTILNYCKIYVK